MYFELRILVFWGVLLCSISLHFQDAPPVENEVAVNLLSVSIC